MNKDALKLITVNRDAVAVNRGFYYQYLTVLSKWVEHYIARNDELVHTEVGDDIKEVGGSLVFTQVKCYTGSFSFKSTEVQKALFNFFGLYLEEKENNPDLRFVFQTNTRVSSKEMLLGKWISEQAVLSTSVEADCIRKTREIVHAELKKIRDRHLSASGITPERKAYIKSTFAGLSAELSDTLFSDFVARIQWDFSEQAPEVAVDLLYSQVYALLKDPVFEDKPANMLMEVFLSEIYRCSQLKDAGQRVVSRPLMQAILLRKTEELDQYRNVRFLDLLDERFSSIYRSLNEMQLEIQGLKKQVEEQRVDTVPQLITAVPFINADAVLQRETEVVGLHEQLISVKHLAITGSGGMGKSTLAKYYAQQYHEQYDHFIWLDAAPGILKSVIYQEDIQDHLGIQIAKPDNEEKVFREFLRKINTLDGRNLLVVDDFNDERYLNDIRSLKNWQVVFTTRKRLAQVENFALTKLSFASAVKLYRQHEATKEASDITFNDFFEAVEYNPLIIEIAAKTVHNALDQDLASFTALLKNQSLDDEELEIDIEVDPDGHSRLLHILKKTFDISGLDRDDAYFLEFLSTLPSDVKISDLVTWYGKDFAAKNKVAFVNLANKLHQKGWLERNGDDIYLHKILQESILYRIRAEKSFILLMYQITWLSHRLREGISGNYNQALQFLRYGESILTKVREQDRESIYQPLLVVENEVLNVYTWIIGQTNTIPRLESLLARSVAYLGDDDAFIGIIHNNLGMAYGEKRNFPAAEKELLIAVDLLKKHHKGSETQLMYAMCNLSMLYIQTGNLVKFQSCFDEAMAFRRKHQLFNDPSFPVQCGMLGFAQQSVGNYKEAIRLYGIAVQAHQLLSSDKKNDLNLILYLNNLSYSSFRDNQQDRAFTYINQAIFHLERLTVKNDNKLFAILLQTLIEIVEKVGDREELDKLLAALANIKNGSKSN